MALSGSTMGFLFQACTVLGDEPLFVEDVTTSTNGTDGTDGTDAIACGWPIPADVQSVFDNSAVAERVTQTGAVR